ncbi:hypothetical protein [Halopiger goleimassiliensis]|uniref:hypothetical protein n=1 Tax=Halopiger goleimassiliensis TaxID=1293048 RepID=UPI000677B4FC|nr:hypothetical protein [Halopiger goleimassiliensis]
MGTFTPDDIGKTVESDAGDALGAVVEVDDETAYVDPDPGVTDSIKAALDWDGSLETTVLVTDDAVAEITTDAIRLEAEFPEESLIGGDAAEAESGTERADRPDESDRQDIGHDPGDPIASNPTEAGGDATGAGAGTEADASESMMEDDEFYDAQEGGARVDPDDEMASPAEEPPDVDPDELDEVEDEASRELEVDPSEVTDGDPEAELSPREDVANREGADVPAVDRESSGPTTEDAGAIDAEMPTESEAGPDVEDDEEPEGEEHDLDEGR